MQALYSQHFSFLNWTENLDIVFMLKQNLNKMDKCYLVKNWLENDHFPKKSLLFSILFAFFLLLPQYINFPQVYNSFQKRNQDNYLLSLCLLLYMKNEFCLVGKSFPSVSHKSPDFDHECSMFVSGNTECMYIGLQAVQQNWFHYGSLNCSFFQIPNLKNRRVTIIIFRFF